MTKNLFKSNKGFTIIELLIFMGIFSILMAFMLQLLTSIFDVQLESQSTSSVTSDGTYILSKLNYDVKNSKGITSPSVGSQSATFSFSNGTISYTYSVLNGNLILTNNSTNSSDQLNGTDTSVTGLNFQRLSDSAGEYNTITVSYTVNSRIIRRGGVNTESFKTTIGTR